MGGVKGEKIPGSEEGLLHSALLISQAQAPPGSQPAPSLLSLSPSLFPGWRPRAADHPRRPNIGRVGPESRVQRASSRQHTGQNIQGRWRRVLEETRALQRGSRRLGRPTTVSCFCPRGLEWGVGSTRGAQPGSLRRRAAWPAAEPLTSTPLLKSPGSPAHFSIERHYNGFYDDNDPECSAIITSV